MRLALHFCDDSEKARVERRAAGKKYIECQSHDRILDYFESKIIGLDISSESPTLGEKSHKSLGRENSVVRFGSHTPRNTINYMDIGFALSEVVLEDSWLVNFLPSLAES